LEQAVSEWEGEESTFQRLRDSKPWGTTMQLVDQLKIVSVPSFFTITLRGTQASDGFLAKQVLGD
jgi:hypothetical protein